jgi:RteC protein
LNDLKDQLQRLEESQPDGIHRTIDALNLCDDSVEQLRELVINSTFASKEQEIHFFKVIKPLFTSLQVYFVNLFRLQMRWPVGSMEEQKNYLLAQSQEITRFYREHQNFYDYYRTGLTNRDEWYFLRGRPDWRSFPDSQILFDDRVFCTQGDKLIAIIQANEKLQEYILQKQHCELPFKQADEQQQNQVKWTDSIVDLVELGYSIYAKGSLNHGNVTITDVMGRLELAFNIKLGDYFKRFEQLSNRKVERAKYVSALVKALLKYMEDGD